MEAHLDLKSKQDHGPIPRNIVEEDADLKEVEKASALEIAFHGYLS